MNSKNLVTGKNYEVWRGQGIYQVGEFLYLTLGPKGHVSWAVFRFGEERAKVRIYAIVGEETDE
jgi:hypothetical protein